MVNQGQKSDSDKDILNMKINHGNKFSTMFILVFTVFILGFIHPRLSRYIPSALILIPWVYIP